MLFSASLIEISPSVIMSYQTKFIHGDIYYFDLYIYKYINYIK